MSTSGLAAVLCQVLRSASSSSTCLASKAVCSSTASGATCRHDQAGCSAYLSFTEVSAFALRTLLTAHTCITLAAHVAWDKLPTGCIIFVSVLQASPAAAYGSTTPSAQRRVSVTATAHRHPSSNATAVTLDGTSSGRLCGACASLLWVWVPAVCQLPLALLPLCSVLSW
jgi:hypothetical protein